jgi:hypothetical protein
MTIKLTNSDSVPDSAEFNNKLRESWVIFNLQKNKQSVRKDSEL